MKPRLVCYSPGVSPLTFCWQDFDDNRNVIPFKKITGNMVQRYLDGPRGKHLKARKYQVHKINGEWTVLRNCRRISDNMLELDGPGTPERYRYRIVHECPADRPLWPNLVRYEFKLPEVYRRPGWVQVVNLDVITCLTAFLRYEEIWLQTLYVPGARITDEQSYPVSKKWEVTSFPDGDGGT